MIYNYADDNILSYSNPDLLETKKVIKSESEDVIEWFDSNHIQANPGKFQAIVLGKRGHGDCESFTIQGTTVKCEDSVKLLGITIDYMTSTGKMEKLHYRALKLVYSDFDSSFEDLLKKANIYIFTAR